LISEKGTCMVTENSTNDSTAALSLKFNNFLVKIADTGAEIDAALRLRFNVFNQEMNEGLSASWETGMDRDHYDNHADHLIVMDQSNQQIVGTYRILAKSRALGNGGFYSEGEFDLSRLKQLPVEMLEMGRSCVHRDYRSGNVIQYLWAGIAKYMLLSRAKFLFGCGSLHTQDVREVSQIFSYLKSKYFAEEKYRVFPHPQNMVPGLRDDLTIENPREVKKKIPSLLKGYFRAGALICGEPARDPEFGTTDFFILLPTEKMTRRYQNHYQASS